VIVANMALFGLCLASPLWLGLWWARRAHSAAASRRIWRVALLALTVLHGLFFIRYFVADQTTFALPTLALLTIWCGVGWGELVTTSTWWRRHIVPVLALGVLCQMWSPAVAYLVVCHTKIEPTRLRTLLYRDEPRYWLLSWKHNENSAGRFAADALRQCPTNTLLYADATVAAPLLVSRQLRLLGDGGATIASYYDTWTRDPQQWRAWLERHQLDHFYVASPIMGYLPAGVEPDKMRVTMLGALYKLESGGHAAVSNKQNGSNDIYKHEANRTENNGDK